MAKTKKEEQAKVGVYICYCGGNISDHVDVEKVRESVEKDPNVAVARTNTFMCSDPGQDLIIEDLKAGKINRVVVASCAPDLHETTFKGAITRAGSNPYLYEHANIREQVSWVHHGDPATVKAIKLVKAAVGKAKFLTPLKPYKVKAKKHVTVVGAGIAGLKASLDLANCGFEVALLEKRPLLGGKLAELDKLSPTGEAVAPLLSKLGQEVINNELITIYPCTQISSFSGYVGNFTLKITASPPGDNDPKLTALATQDLQPGELIPFAGIYPGNIPEQKKEQKLLTGAIILATGLKTYQPRNGEYGYKVHPQVVTLQEFIALMATARDQEKEQLEINGQAIKNIVMIHCVGSRQIPGIHQEDEQGHLNEYCSRTCCSSLLFWANQIREKFPKSHVYEMYRDIRTYGRGQEELYQQAAQNEVCFLRFEPGSEPVVQKRKTPDYPLEVIIQDTLTFGEQVCVPADLVVLGTGIKPQNIQQLVELIKLPVGEDGFLQEVHPKLRPVELAINGIVLAGTCQAPMDSGEACNSASCAAVKSVCLLNKGYIELDPFVAQVDPDKCKGHGHCLEACLKEGALNLTENDQGKKAEVNPALCLGCGACVAVCPENAIDLNGSTLQQFEAMVDMIVADQLAQPEQVDLTGSPERHT